MTQGIWVNGRRPKSKKEVKEAASIDAAHVSLEATSIFGNEHDGPLTTLPEGTYTFVGPDPRTSRKFFGNVVIRGDKITIK